MGLLTDSNTIEEGSAKFMGEEIAVYQDKDSGAKAWL